MGITIMDILQLKIMSSAQVIAGNNGLDKEVLQINFSDSPLDEEDPGSDLVSRGDLYINSFYMGHENKDIILNLIQFYIDTGSSGCIVIKYHFSQLPQMVLDLANDNNYPIIMIDPNTPYAKLIKDISELIFTEQIYKYSENKINRILFDNLSEKELYDIVKFLVPNLPSSYICFYISYNCISSNSSKMLKNDLKLYLRHSFLRYHKGGFLILDTQEHANITYVLNLLIDIFHKLNINFLIGVSNEYTKPDHFIYALKEAMSAHEISQITENQITHYRDVSIYGLLFPLRNIEILTTYCIETLGPLREYEKRHSINMIETIKLYLKTNGNIKEISRQLHVHENTIRFRISKAKSILGLENEDYAFIERVSLALKGEDILQNGKIF